MKYYSLLAMVLFIAKLSSAQNDTAIFNDVIVHGNRLNLRLDAAAVIDKKQMNSLPGNNPAVWLANISGVDIRQRGPEGVQSDIGIRGGSFDQTLILLNGMKLNDPQTGHHTLNLPITNSALERIEIVKSSSSRLYGINALSGSVNFITKVPEKNLIHAGLFAGDFGLYGLNAGLAYNTKHVGQYFAFSKTSSNGYLPNTDFDVLQMFYQTRINIKKSQVNVLCGYSDRSFGARGFYVLNSNEYESIQTAFTGLQHEIKLKRLKIKSQLYYRYNQDRYNYIRSNPKFFENLHFSHTISAEVHAAYESVIGQTGFGLDSRTELLKSSNLGNRERNIYGLFMEHRFMLLNKKLQFTPGIYITNYAVNSVSYLPGIDANYALNLNLKLFASADKGMRLPTFTDLYYNGPSNVGNPDLKAEEAISYELGVAYHKKHLNVSGSLFQRISDNLIDWARPDPATKWQPLNLNTVKLRGCEFNVKIVLKKLIEKIQANYTFLDADASVKDAYQSRYILSNIRHQAQGLIGLNWSNAINQSVTVRHINRLGMTDYTLLDSKLSYSRKGLKLYTEVSNILNIAYLEAGYVAMPGRWFKIGIEFVLSR